MAIDWGRVALGAGTGGQSELWRYGAGLLGGKKTTSQVPLETPEQQAARQKLMGFADTGVFGDFKAGADIGLGYGDFNATGLEQQGQTALQKLLSGGLPDTFNMGDAALKDYLATDPRDVSAQFDPFRAQTERLMRDSDTALRRGAGFAGNLYSTDTIRKLGDVQARGNETLIGKLAELTDSSLNRRLSAIPLAYQAGQARQEAQLQQVGAAHQYGALVRQLNDASIKARDNELLRRRQELQLPIQAAQSVAGQNANFGIPSVTTSPYQELLSLVGQVGGTALGTYLGGPAGGAVGGKAGQSVLAPDNSGGWPAADKYRGYV